MSKKLASPNDSLQQSTREPSQRSAEFTSLDASSFSSRRFLASSTQIGGGSIRDYIRERRDQMHSAIEATTRKLELERRRLHKLDKDLGAYEQEYDGKRQRYKLFQSSQDDAVQHKEAEVRQLEKRLIKAIADLNKGTSENEQLREQIDLLRREREILNTVFKQLERGIGSSGRAMERLKMSINEERMVGEEAKQKSNALGKMLDRERRQFQADAEKLKKEVLEISKLQEEQEKPVAPERTLEGPTSSRGKNRRNYMVADEEEAFSEQAMHRRILKTAFLNTIQRRHIKQHKKNIEVFEQAFATIRSTTGISDIEEIVKIFVILEQRNFSLLTYVNQLNQDIEYVYKRNRELESQMKDHRTEERESSARKESALSEVSAQIAKTKASTGEKNRMIKEAEAALDDCRPLIWNIVKFLKQEIPNLVRAAFESGDAPPMRAVAPDEHEENLNHFLMYVEEAVSQFKSCLSQDVKPVAHAPKPSATRTGHGEAPRAARGPGDLPSMHAGDADSDDDPETGMGDRPWTRSELRERAQANVQRRRRRPGQGGQRPGHEERRMDVAEDASVSMAAASSDGAVRRDAGPPPPKEYAASSVTSKESGGDSGPTGSGVSNNNIALSKSPSMSGKPSAVEHTLGKEGPQEEDSGDRGGKGGYDMWWRTQGKEKRK